AGGQAAALDGALDLAGAELPVVAALGHDVLEGARVVLEVDEPAVGVALGDEGVGLAAAAEVEDAVQGDLELRRLVGREAGAQHGLPEALGLAELAAERAVVLEIAARDLLEVDLAFDGRGDGRGIEGGVVANHGAGGNLDVTTRDHGKL